MEPFQWLDAVRPSGRGFVFALKNGKHRQILFDDNKNAAECIGKYIVEEKDVFVSLANFQEGSASRKSEFAESLLSVWLDIDCGNSKSYQNQNDAVKALRKFCESCALPKPSLIINSGGGIHCYWCFNKVVDVTEWIQISQDLKALCFSKGLNADPAVMGDPSRVMRVPESHNYKDKDNPKAVAVLHPKSNEITRFNAPDFHKIILAALPQSAEVYDFKVYSTAKNTIDETTRALIGGFVTVPESLVESAKLKNALDYLSPDVGRGHGSFYDAKGVPESAYWLAAIWAIASLNWNCGKQIAENWSRNSDRFTEEGFTQAWNAFNQNHPNAISIGSLYKRAKELGWQENTSQEALATLPILEIHTTQPRFKLMTFDELSHLPATEWLVKGVLPSQGLASIYGPSGSGKTFLALDLLMAIAGKSNWFGFKVKNVPVVYVCLEGMGGITRRIKAWEIKHHVPAPSNFKIILDNFNLMDRNQVELLAKEINQAKFTSGLIVIDTLNQASPTADENSSRDMGVIISHLKQMQDLTKGLVLIIHHSGKNTSAGLRGHSSLKAALDTNIEVIGGENRSWSIEKSKDGESGACFPFKLEVQKIEIDSDDQEITSCTIERDSSAIFKRPEPSGKNQKIAHGVIKQELLNSTVSGKCHSGSLTKCMKVEDVIIKVAGTLTTTAPNKRNHQARTIVRSLTQGGYLHTGLEGEEGWLWLP